MIVTDDHVSAALDYLAASPHPLAVARKAVVDAENKAKRVFASAFLDAQGSVAAKEAIATTTDAYSTAKAEESAAIQSLEQQRAMFRWAENVIELYRTEAANMRAAERIR